MPILYIIYNHDNLETLCRTFHEPLCIILDLIFIKLLAILKSASIFLGLTV